MEVYMHLSPYGRFILDMRRIATILSCSVVFVLFSAIQSFAQIAAVSDARGLIDRTQADLRRAAELERRHNSKAIERYDDAQKHLSEFDREYTKGHFDKGKLDSAIDDVREVVEHN